MERLARRDRGCRRTCHVGTCRVKRVTSAEAIEQFTSCRKAKTARKPPQHTVISFMAQRVEADYSRSITASFRSRRVVGSGCSAA